MLRTVYALATVFVIAAGAAGLVASRLDMECQIQEWEYIVLKESVLSPGVRLISPVYSDTEDTSWTAYPPLSTVKSARPTKLVSFWFGYDPLLLSMYSAGILAFGLLLSAFPPAWPMWSWLLRPSFAASASCRYVSRVMLGTIAVSLCSLLICQGLTPGGIVWVGLTPVEEEWQAVAWQLRWVSLTAQRLLTLEVIAAIILAMSATAQIALSLTAETGTEESLDRNPAQ